MATGIPQISELKFLDVTRPPSNPFLCAKNATPVTTNNENGKQHSY